MKTAVGLNDGNVMNIYQIEKLLVLAHIVGEKQWVNNVIHV